MTLLVISHDSEGSIKDWRYEADHDYEADADEITVDSGTVDHRELVLHDVDVETNELVKSRQWPERTLTDILDRADIPLDLKAAYRDGAAVWEQAKTDWQDAKADADAAAQAYDDAPTTQEKADALDARNDALQAQEVAVATLFNDGVIPAMDALFQVAMGEEP